MHNIDLLLALDKPIPRYTSYPTAPEWGDISHESYLSALARTGDSHAPIALYFHIPFCRSMCLFCGCSVVLNRKPENEEKYVDYLIKEIQLASKALRTRKEVCQLHFGGGTPTKLSCEQLRRLMGAIHEHFILLPHAEIAMEIDPRTVFEDRGEKLHLLKELGFNRVSFGVQDTNDKVQEAVRRRQSYGVTKYTYDLARTLEFSGVSMDLIYGLPYQTLETFTETIAKIIELAPDRLSLFSYAKIPWMKAHQKAIDDATLPSQLEKFSIYLHARSALVQAGYKAIGMDHFAKEHDEMAHAYTQKRLQRNFQGYTVLDVDNLISFGVTSIGYCQYGYFQNVKELETYYDLLDNDLLPVFRGKLLHNDDLIRRWVIQRLMCDFRVDKNEFLSRFSQSFDSYFTKEKEQLQPLKDLQLVQEDAHQIQATPTGELFIRNITSCFDWYLSQKDAHKSFSKAI